MEHAALTTLHDTQAPTKNMNGAWLRYTHTYTHVDAFDMTGSVIHRVVLLERDIGRGGRDERRQGIFERTNANLSETFVDMDSFDNI